MESEPVKFEIVYDPIAEACANGLQMDASKHRILPDGDFILWVRRHYKRSTLFEYEHLETGNLVLADWIYAPHFAQELDAYPPEERPDRTYLDHRLVSVEVTARRAKERLRKAADLKRQIAEARHDTRKNAASYYRKLGMELEATRMAMGAMPVQAEMENPESHGQMKEDLARLARGRVITHG